MKHLPFVFFLLILAFSQIAKSQSTTFTYTGAAQTYTVPSGITKIQVEANGAQGGGNFGGKGGKVIATIQVTPGAVLYIYVGGRPGAQLGQGGFNGGGAVLALPCAGSSDGWPGGGASDIRTSVQLTDRILVAGGGGGQGWTNGLGGAGGGDSGTDGAASWIVNTNGKAATSSSGGAGGIYGTSPDSPAPAGTFGAGGNSSPLSTYCTGGGGGGGWYGGGGGYVSAGGGGSGYSSFPGTIDVLSTAGVNAGNGSVVITLLCSGLITSLIDTVLCQGSRLTLTASSVNGGTISWDNDVLNDVPFTLADTGLTTYTASSSDINDCPYTIHVRVNSSPTVNAGLDIGLCNDGSIDTLLHATGNADTYSWNNEIADSVIFTPTLGTTTYIVTGSDTTNGCQVSDSVNISVHALPSLTFTYSDEIEGNDGTVSVSINTGNGPYTYDWSNDGTGDNDDLSSLSGLVAGRYTVIVTDGNGCTSFGTTIVGSQVSIQEADIELVVYPNPATDNLKIELPGEFEYRIIDIPGKTVRSGKGNHEAFINISAMNEGIYILMVRYQENERFIRVIKQ